MTVPRLSPALALCASSLLLLAAPAGAAPLKGTDFRASVPDGWTLRAERPGGGTRTFYAASAGRLDAVNVPRRGRLGLALLDCRLTTAGRRMSLSTLATRTVGFPRSASRIRRLRRGTTSVDGTRAVFLRFRYRYRGRTIYQANVVTRRAGRLVFIETTSDLSRRPSNDRVRGRFLSTWQWR